MSNCNLKDQLLLVCLLRNSLGSLTVLLNITILVVECLNSYLNLSALNVSNLNTSNLSWLSNYNRLNILCYYNRNSDGSSYSSNSCKSSVCVLRWRITTIFWYSP